MAIPSRPAWSTIARDKLPAARAAEARQLAKQRAAAERARAAAIWWRPKPKVAEA